MQNSSAKPYVYLLGRYRWAVLLVFTLLFLSGCAGSPNYAPVSDLHSPPERTPDSYVVRSGDTLYSIAFRYGLDFRGLAAANGIGSNYQIFPGQRLRMDDKAIAVASVPPSRPSQPSERTASRPSNVAAKPISPPPRPPEGTSKTQSQVLETTEISAWQWPTEGSIVRGFNASQYAHKGIDIAGKQEQPVKAVANGVVVYAGSGLVGYGKLLIVKHSERYLSAYAHNNRLMVKEGESIRQGQTIALMGDTGTDSTKLHFEIRKDGKPIDPVSLLPKRT